jgi:PAS domain S-box-containing protein
MESEAAPLSALRDLTQALARAEAAPAVYERALDGLQQALGVSRASILTFDADGVARFRAWTGLSDAYRAAVEGHCPWKAGDRDAVPLTVPDVLLDESLAPYREVFAREKIRAVAFIPLMGAGGCLGKFMLYYGEPHAFTRGELMIAEVIATQAAYAAERVRSAEDARQQAARLSEQAALLDLAHDAILVTTLEGEILYWNEGARKLYGWTAAEAAGRISYELLHTEFPVPFAEIRERVRCDGMWDGELIHTTRTGQRKSVSSRWVQRPAHDGFPMSVLRINRDVTEQRAHERALRESEERLSLAVESTGLGAFDYFPQTGKLLWSDGTRRHLGIGADVPATAETFLRAIHPADRARIERAVDDAVRGQTPAQFTFEYRTVGLDDGVERWIVSRGRTFFDETGAAVRLVGISLDVTERQRAAQRIEDILSSIRESFIALDREWRFTYVNQRVADKVGIPREKLLGANLWEAAPQYRETAFYYGYRRVLEERVPVQFAVTDADGSHCWEVHAYPTEEGLAAYILDVSDRWSAESGLRLSEERYRSLVQATSAVVFRADERGQFAEVQEDWTRFTGQPWSEHRAMGWLSAFHPDDAVKVGTAWENALRLRARCWTEGRLRHAASAEYRHVLFAAVPIVAQNGEVREWVGALTDVHERRQMEVRLRDAAKLESLGILAGGIAHDFNNLLTGILGNASLLEDELGDRYPARSRVDMIVEASQRAADLTRQMLAYSGRGHFFIEPVDVGARIAQMRGLIAASIPKTIDVRIEIPPGLPPVKADGGQFHQLVMNLLINAGEAIAETGCIRLTAEVESVPDPRHVSAGDLAPGEYVVLRVADTGCGIDAAAMARIFDPFFTTKFTGRGLGLAAALGIARGHSGAIDVQSRPGQGAVFSVFLPTLRETATIRPSPAATRKAGASILVIDDEEIVLRTARAALERNGYTVVTAANGKEGVEQFARANPKFDLVLLDMTMPVMGGEEALRRLREIDPTARIVGSSGYSEQEATRRFGEGLAGFLQKPYSTQRLCQTIKAAQALATNAHE